jgi:hypothetical protein
VLLHFPGKERSFAQLEEKRKMIQMTTVELFPNNDQMSQTLKRQKAYEVDRARQRGKG